MSRLPTATALIVALCSLLPASAQDSTIKVQIFAETLPVSVAIIPDGSALELYGDPLADPIATVSSPDTVFVRRGSVDLRTLAGDLQINLTDLHVTAGKSGVFIVEVSRPDESKLSRRFSGRLHIANDAGRGRLRLVNEVDMETYVAAVVGKEYDLDEGAGARAMAIVARTFGARSARVGDGVATDGLASQVYRGVDAITDASRGAAESTRGKILIYDNAPIVAVYSASNGGHSASNADVWEGEPLPYLKARKDRYDRKASPHREWTFNTPVDELHDLLAAKLGEDVTSLNVSRRTGDGRVQSVSAKTASGGSEEISGNDFRMMVSARYGSTSLRSTKFELDRRGDAYEFKGSGFGHGVGLSQWGAHEMSNRGYSDEEILRHYYPGAKLSTMDDVDESPIPTFASVLRPARGGQDETHERMALPAGKEKRLIGWTGSMSDSPSQKNESRRRLGW